jgi:hypothetical protein
MKRQTNARVSGRVRWQDVPQVRPEVSGVPASTRGSFATEEIVLNTAPTTLNQRVTPSRTKRGHGDGDLTVWPRTATMHGNRVPVHRVAVRELAREGAFRSCRSPDPRCRATGTVENPAASLRGQRYFKIFSQIRR